ncbi:SLBB domain-containing protein [Marixanthomonas sp. SCSIO 43207]|uniref:SLBB domain-containing protein n=1 Tax=Marixanthomonas sp. SCSIO 43207 TaxID=2779360 RepID=UPI001CA9D659|nr:SLBB domain-containing protein [Marixanthomonas sp. SCSIO 43207]UAB80411.1 SLBB domain-containing protein [Marixanthomonas sp. SCSIO 43207]
MNIISKQTITFFLVLFCLAVPSIEAQTVPSPSVLSSNVEDLTDEQIQAYWQKAKAQGYTMEQLKAIAASRGISPSQIAELERRLNEMGDSTKSLEGKQIDSLREIDETPKLGFTGNEIKEGVTKDPLFGYDFFNNQNISFTPNMNLATPTNYELGPGDEISINLWGAAETNYSVEVDREGAIRISNIGLIYVSGLTMEEASAKIKNKLKRIYSGINASDSSPYKVFLNISLVNVRTVQVNIIGEVKVPGTYSLSALSTVLNALYASGGPTKQGTFREIKLVRNGEEITFFDVYDYLINGSQIGNKTLRDQDVIIVAPYISRVGISGSVKRPGKYEMKAGETLNDLLLFSGGFTSNAYKERVVLERIEGDRKVVKEILVDNEKETPLQDGDSLAVKSVIDKFENKISIEGAVYRPGRYEFTPGITVKDLISKAAGVNDQAFLQRGLLFSTNDGVIETATPFSVSEVLSGKTEIQLQPDDRVEIFNKYNLSESYTLTIDGAVNNPKTIPYVQNMTVEDLVLVGGGFTDAANVSKIDIYRRVDDDNYETLSKNFKVSANGQLTLEDGSNFVLQPNDRVSVRYLRGFSEQIKVVVSGEANYPGSYTIENKNEKISDLLNRAGGVTEYAFVEGATLVRKNPFYKEETLKETFEGLAEKEEVTGSEDDTLKNRREFRVGINLQDIIDDEDSKHNLVLKTGDQLIIPSTKQTVKVEGEVLVPSLVRYEKGMTLKDYISKSGGFSTDAKKGKTYVVYANGDIASTKHFLFFRSYPKLEPGAAILVPAKPENRNKLTTQEVIGISTGLTTLGLLIDRLLQ